MSNKLILVLNCGSSSLKCAIIDTSNSKKHFFCSAESLHLPEACIKWEIDEKKRKIPLNAKASHSEALNFIINNILIQKPELFTQLVAIGHRIVHGGEKHTRSTIINEDVIQDIKDTLPFAPLHHPAHLIGIAEAFKFFPQLKEKNVAVFDTAFHQTIPEESYLYALPYDLYRKYKIRRYGFHGISHYYVTQKAAQMLEKSINELNIITCHLGNGSSISAIRNGKCVDTSMGLTPLEGLVMGTRSGDIDPAIIFFLHENLGMNIKRIKSILTEESGLLGLTEVTSDCRYIEENYFTKEDARRTMNVYCHRLAKYIGSYVALMDGYLDAIVFTGGIGENATMIREFTLNKLSILGFKIDHNRNLDARFGKSGFINEKDTRPIIVISTDEELIIAQETDHVVH